jgi:hypothetical protein
MASADDHRRLYERWLLELWNGDESVAEEILADDFVIHQLRAQPGESEAVRGPQAGLEMVRMGGAPFSDLICAIDIGPIVEGDMVAARWTLRGRYAAASRARPRPKAPGSPSVASTCGSRTAALRSTG